MKKVIITGAFLVVLVIGFFIFNSSNPETTEDRVILTGETKEFDIIAKQWQFLPDEIEVNKGDTVILNVESIDVNHGLAIPKLGIDEFLSPGKTAKIEFVANQEGTFVFVCSVSCGVGHSGMRGKIIIK